MTRTDDPTSTNIAAVAQLERDSHRRRSPFERVIDAVRAWAGSPMFILLHVFVIGSWIGWNVRGGGFDPYPFGFLNMCLAMEAIFLSSFVLMAQDRMTREADRRDHLNLQVDLLAEQELTAILHVVVAIANRSGIDVRAQVPEIDRLCTRTDVQKLATSLERQLGDPHANASTVTAD
jgi:uncharacterized membrane protein